MKRIDFAKHWYAFANGKFEKGAWDGSDKGLVECLEFMELCKKHAIFYETLGYYECPLCYLGVKDEDLPVPRIYATEYAPPEAKEGVSAGSTRYT